MYPLAVKMFKRPESSNGEGSQYHKEMRNFLTKRVTHFCI